MYSPRPSHPLLLSMDDTDEDVTRPDVYGMVIILATPHVHINDIMTHPCTDIWTDLERLSRTMQDYPSRHDRPSSKETLEGDFRRPSE